MWGCGVTSQGHGAASCHLLPASMLRPTKLPRGGEPLAQHAAPPLGTQRLRKRMFKGLERYIKKFTTLTTVEVLEHNAAEGWAH